MIDNAGYYARRKQNQQYAKRGAYPEADETASEIMNIPEQAFVVLLKENDPDNIGTGGEVLTKVLAKQNQK